MQFLKIATIIGIIIFSSIENTMSTNDSLSNTPSNVFLTTKPSAGNTTYSMKNTAAAGIPPTEPVTVENTSFLIPSISTIKTTPNVLITDVSTSNTTVAGIISSSMAAGNSCSLLDLHVGKLPLDSKFMVFRNFFYDGSTFCLKWTILGDLNDVKRCIIKYTFKMGTKSVIIKCPSVNNEIITWRSKEEIYKICLDIYAPKKTSFCNYTLYGRTTAAVSETTMLNETSTLQHSTMSIVTETEPFKATEAVRLTEVSTDNHLDYFTVSINVYSNSSSTTSDIFLTTKPSTASMVQSIKDTAASGISTTGLATVDAQKVSSDEDYSDEIAINENDTTLSTMTRELITLNKTSIIHTINSNISSGSSSTASIIESITPTKDILSNTTSNIFLAKHMYIPFICLLILFIFIVGIIIFKNIKKQESRRYNVLDEKNNYDQSVRLSSQSTRHQSIQLSYLATENFDDV